MPMSYGGLREEGGASHPYGEREGEDHSLGGFSACARSARRQIQEHCTGGSERSVCMNGVACGVVGAARPCTERIHFFARSFFLDSLSLLLFLRSSSQCLLLPSVLSPFGRRSI